MSTRKKAKPSMTGWRKTTNELIDLLDRGLNKVERRIEVIEKGDRKPMFEALKALQPLEQRIKILEETDSNVPEGLELAARIDGLKADFERFRSDARTQLAAVEEGRRMPDDYCADAEGKEGIWIVSLSDGGIVHFVQKIEL